MKRILIIGINSYIGNSFQTWMNNNEKEHIINRISIRDNEWRKKDFSNYDVILYVAGIAHRKENKTNTNIYYNVNRDLSYEVAVKAKKEKVLQFIFISSMSVYGIETGEIDETSPLKPKSHYGKSKLQGEELIGGLQDLNFNVAIIRPPMVYGKGCKGNYQKLKKISLFFPVFPCIGNERSMIYIDNLCEFIRLIVKNKDTGIYFPQNIEYVRTDKMVEEISKLYGKKILFTRAFNPLILLLKRKLGIIRKIFGNLVYAKSLSVYKENYQVKDWKASIKLTEMERE